MVRTPASPPVAVAQPFGSASAGPPHIPPNIERLARKVPRGLIHCPDAQVPKPELVSRIFEGKHQPFCPRDYGAVAKADSVLLPKKILVPLDHTEIAVLLYDSFKTPEQV